MTKKNFPPLFAVLAMFTGCAPLQPVVVVQYSHPAQVAPPAGGEQDAPDQEATYQTFYDELSPYGKWVDYPDYGYVWQAGVNADFEPYSSNGHWVYSEDAWTWVSGYPWGWAAFHYGRWFYDDNYGWLWMPGYEWAPAWVTWGQSGGYYGWAPLGPKVRAGDNWQPPARSWTFVRQEHITKPNLHDFVINKTDNVTIVKNVTIINNIINNTTVINNNNKTIVNNNTTVINNNGGNNPHVHPRGVFNAGPQVKEVEKATNAPVQKMQVYEHPKPAPAVVTNNNTSITVYRPVVKGPAPAQPKPAPHAVTTYQPKKKN